MHEINVEKPAPTLEDIETEKARLDQKIESVMFRLNLEYICLVALFFLYFIVMVALVIMERFDYNALWVTSIILLGVAAIWLICNIKTNEHLVEALKNDRDLSNSASNEVYLTIQHWLDDPIVKKYRDSVVANNREFTKGEIIALESWVENSKYRAAYNAVYLK